MYTIYLITNTVNDKKYVGQTKQNVAARWARHKADARNGGRTYFCAALRKYGAESFVLSVLEYAETKGITDELERHYIQEHTSHLPDKGYNTTLGGEGGEPTDIARQKMSHKSSERWQDPEYRSRLSESHKGLLTGEKNPMYGKHEDHPWFGREHSAETKEKISEARKELFSDPEFKQRMSEANTGKQHTAEGRANISAALAGNQYRKGIPHTPEKKAQIAESMRQAWARKRQKILHPPTAAGIE